MVLNTDAFSLWRCCSEKTTTKKVNQMKKTVQDHLNEINQRRAVALGVTGVGVLAASTTHAEVDVSAAIAGSKANDNVDATGAFVIGVVLGLFAISVIRRALGK